MPQRVIALHLATKGNLGFHTDELYYLDCARHPALVPASNGSRRASAMVVERSRTCQRSFRRGGTVGPVSARRSPRAAVAVGLVVRTVTGGLYGLEVLWQRAQGPLMGQLSNSRSI